MPKFEDKCNVQPRSDCVVFHKTVSHSAISKLKSSFRLVEGYRFPIIDLPGITIKSTTWTLNDNISSHMHNNQSFREHFDSSVHLDSRFV